jgi:hypothetical protein
LNSQSCESGCRMHMHMHGHERWWGPDDERDAICGSLSATEMERRARGRRRTFVQERGSDMQEQIEARAVLNGGGAGYGDAAHGIAPVLDAETLALDAETMAVMVPATERARRASPVLGPIRADPVRYGELRRLVTETVVSLIAISVLDGIAETTLRNLIKAEGWVRPAKAPKSPVMPDGAPLPRKRLAADIADVGMVRSRLLRAVDRQIDKVDGRLKKKGAVVEEKDSRILGHLAKTLSALMEMGEGGKTSRDAEPPDRGDVEERLAERIKRWARGEQGY